MVRTSNLVSLLSSRMVLSPCPCLHSSGTAPCFVSQEHTLPLTAQACFLRKYNLSLPSAVASRIAGGSSPPPPCVGSVSQKARCSPKPVRQRCRRGPFSAGTRGSEELGVSAYPRSVGCCVEVPRQLQKLTGTEHRSPKHSACSCCGRSGQHVLPIHIKSVPIFAPPPDDAFVLLCFVIYRCLCSEVLSCASHD